MSRFEPRTSRLHRPLDSTEKNFFIQLQQREEEVDQSLQRRVDQRGRRSVGGVVDVVGAGRLAKRCRRRRRWERQRRERDDDVHVGVDEGREVDRVRSPPAPVEHRLGAEGQHEVSP